MCNMHINWVGGLNTFLLQHKAIGIWHKFKNLDRPFPMNTILIISSIMIQDLSCFIVISHVIYLVDIISRF